MHSARPVLLGCTGTCIGTIAIPINPTRLNAKPRSRPNPVSYTHLDVYKRQPPPPLPPSSAGSPPPMPTGPGSPRDVPPLPGSSPIDPATLPKPLRDEILAPDPVAIDTAAEELKDGANPVSYTHLDVYKRQDHAMSPAAKWREQRAAPARNNPAWRRLSGTGTTSSRGYRARRPRRPWQSRNYEAA